MIVMLEIRFGNLECFCNTRIMIDHDSNLYNKTFKINESILIACRNIILELIITFFNEAVSVSWDQS